VDQHLHAADPAVSHSGAQIRVRPPVVESKEGQT
jgi:hypothetical protein